MLLVLPLHSSTPGIEQIGRDLKKKGSLNDHSLRIISTREDEGLAYIIGDELADHFRKVTTQTLPDTPQPRSQTLLANHMLIEALDFLREYQYGENEAKDAPLLYFTPTFRPVAANWLNELQSEFFLKGAPTVMGRSESSVGGKKDPNFRRITVGPVIFGKKFLDQVTLLPFLDGKQHWRTRMCHEIALTMVETKQIGPGGKSLLREMPAVKV